MIETILSRAVRYADAEQGGYTERWCMGLGVPALNPGFGWLDPMFALIKLVERRLQATYFIDSEHSTWFDESHWNSLGFSLETFPVSYVAGMIIPESAVMAHGPSLDTIPQHELKQILASDAFMGLFAEPPSSRNRQLDQLLKMRISPSTDCNASHAEAVQQLTSRNLDVVYFVEEQFVVYNTHSNDRLMSLVEDLKDISDRIMMSDWYLQNRKNLDWGELEGSLVKAKKT